ncbi:DUF1176 domain-containing protein [Acetobacter garciniae]|uniref:DUF1176 domain-containing protein n=1 Tax=Acetobacter garciniae TaxID=2817435 RepID=UPI0038B31781
MFVVPRAKGGLPVVARLPVPVLKRQDTGDYGPALTYPDFDSATGTLTTYRQRRAWNDCGTQAEWRWDRTHFVLTGMNFQAACGGSAPLGEWPALYRSIPIGEKE